MMTRVAERHGLADGWVVVQAGVYRYTASGYNGVRVRSVLNKYLATEVWWK